MNCRDVEPFLDQLVRTPGESGADRFAMREHLASCSACQRTLRSLAQWDGQLTRAMNEIAVPVNLSHRLTAALNDAASADPFSKRATEQPRPRNGWSRAFSWATIAGVLFVVAWWAWQFMRPPSLSPAHVASVLRQSAEELPTVGDSQRLLPQQWSSLNGSVVTGGGKKMELGELRLSLIVFPLNVRPKRGPAVAGSLFVIPKSRWTPVAAAAVSQAVVQYSPPHVWIVWAETDFVYLLALNGPSQLLEQLQRQLGGNHGYL